MEKDYSKYLIKNYKYWSIYIHENQSYLGRCVIWCKREDALDMVDANESEQKELFQILKDLQEALKVCFSPDWFNYAFLGNETVHLHGHFIPRYSKSKNFMGIIFEDKLYGHNYRTDRDFQISEEVLQEIKNKIIEAL